MRIVGIETLRLRELPNLTLVQLHASTGETGLGETYYGAGAVEAVVHEIMAPALLGAPLPDTCADLGQVLDDRLFYVGTTGSGAEIRALSAVDIALWDLLGHHRGSSLSELIGGAARASVPVYNTCAGTEYMRSATGQRSTNWGLDASTGPQSDNDLWRFLNEADRLAEDLLASGVSAMKIWPFDLHAEQTRGTEISSAQMQSALEPLRRIRQAVGDQMRILVELHGLWEPGPAKEILTELAAFDVYWAEDPLATHRVAELAGLRATSDVRIAAGETAGAVGGSMLVSAAAVDVLIADIGWCGGITGALRQADHAAHADIEFALHDCSGPVVLAASTQAAACLDHVHMQETTRSYYNGWYPALVTGLPELSNGHIHVGSAPGHGIALRPDVWRRADARVRLSGRRNTHFAAQRALRDVAAGSEDM
ncbi:MAG TPA: mandelate racemase/muconate lactonizing enzyme family protein [Actinocrinis sp.]|jgi:L-alanine-DL-glutamate epimerase-like enolase superfamily enzyme